MARGWDLSDTLDLDALFATGAAGAEDAGSEEPADEAAAIAKLRSGLNDIGRSYWGQYGARAGGTLFVPGSDPSAAKGAAVLLFAVKNKPSGKGEQRHLAGEVAGVPFSADLDDRVKAMFDMIAAVQKEWGWKASANLELGGVVTNIEAPSAKKPPALEIAVRAVRVPGQFLVLDLPQDGPYVPGLDSARARLAEFRSVPAPARVATPESILPVLNEALSGHDLELFGNLWVSDTIPGMHQRRFKQFLKIHDSCGGNISFDRFDPSHSPDKYPDCKNVRMFVKREYTNGTVGYSPLVLVKEGDEWRIQRGII